MKDLLFEIAGVDTLPISAMCDMEGAQTDRQRRIAAMKRKEAIAASLTGDWLARKLAAELLKCDPDVLSVADGKYGKPMLSGLNAEISIAHSGKYAAAAAAKRPVGIDIERVRPILRTMLVRICSPDELKWVQKKQDMILPRFFRLWTMKEAYGKMLGVGIFAPQRFCARFVKGELIEVYPDCLFFFPEAPEGYSASVCIARER